MPRMRLTSDSKSGSVERVVSLKADLAQLVTLSPTNDLPAGDKDVVALTDYVMVVKTPLTLEQLAMERSRWAANLKQGVANFIDAPSPEAFHDLAGAMHVYQGIRAASHVLGADGKTLVSFRRFLAPSEVHEPPPVVVRSVIEFCLQHDRLPSMSDITKLLANLGLMPAAAKAEGSWQRCTDEMVTQAVLDGWVCETYDDNATTGFEPTIKAWKAYLP